MMVTVATVRPGGVDLPFVVSCFFEKHVHEWVGDHISFLFRDLANSYKQKHAKSNTFVQFNNI